MKIYVVGGTVRDRLLGKIPRDTDYLVVDASAEDLLKRGLVKVGQSFPIFLDPETQDEYTLGISVEEDLKRRDLTINAMSMDELGTVIDPFHGKADLSDKILRHVDRENFFTDPLRVMRTARFQAQFPDFTIHPETISLMKEVALTPAYRSLPAERIIKELKRVFESPLPSLFFVTLSKVGARGPYFPEGDLKSLDQAPKKEELQFAAFMTKSSPEELDEMRARLNFQNDWYEMARAWILYQEMKTDAEDVLNFLYEVDAFRKPWIISNLEELGAKNLESFELTREIGMKDIDQKHQGKEIYQAIKEKRLSILKSRN